MKSYTHFTLFERECLLEMRKEGKSFREIGKEIGKDASSVCREYNRNFSKKKKRYNVWRATTLYIVRRKNCVRKPIIQKDGELYQKITDCLKKYWSPEIIANYCKSAGYQISFSTIYKEIKAGAFSDEGITSKSHLRRKGKKKHAKHGNHATIHPERSIHDRPEIVEKKERLGDWEGDTVCGANNKSCLVTQVDRASKYLLMAKSKDHKKESVRAAIKSAFEQLPEEIPRLTMTLDNGSEFADFKGIEKDIEIEIYFADPHSPWQRGLNESVNDMIRFFFPKGTDFNKVSDEDIQYVASIINSRPRKCLGFISPIDFISKKCCT